MQPEMRFTPHTCHLIGALPSEKLLEKRKGKERVRNSITHATGVVGAELLGSSKNSLLLFK